MNEEIIKPEILELDKKLCSLAENYILNSYYRVGSRSYAWTENDYEDDLEAENVVSGELPPSDEENYSWWEIVSCDIHKSEVDDRDDEIGQYCVTVEAWVAVSSGGKDDEIDESVTPDIRTIYVHIKRDKEEGFFVAFTEE